MFRSLHKSLLSAAFTAVVLPILAADGRIPISAVPYTISAPGSYYLTRDLTIASGTAITVSASNVTLDLNGHTLTNSAGAGFNYGVSNLNGAFSRLRVTGGRIVGGAAGVYFYGNASGELRVDHVEIAGATGYGVSLSGTVSGLIMPVVESVQVIGTGGNIGINLGYAAGGRVSGNVVQGSSDGIDLAGCRGVLVQDNTVSDSANYGIALMIFGTDISRDNIITGNTVQKSTSNGISLNAARGNRVTFNVVSNNGFGISLTNSNNNTVSDNTLVENANYGLTLNGASNTLVTRNSIQGTQGAGHGIYLINGSRFNSFDGNSSTGNVGDGMLISDAASSGNIYSNNRLPNNGTGNGFGTGNFSAGGNNAGGANF